MSDADRVREARDLCDELYWIACSSKSVSDARLDAYAAVLRAECAAEIAALKADGERLDWLNDNAYRDLRIDEWNTGVELGEGDSGPLLAKAPTLRDAIDAARASETRGRE